MRFEFHVSRRAREKYDFDAALFATDGTLLFADFAAARDLAHAMNASRDLTRAPEIAIRAGELSAAGLKDEILHFAIARFRETYNPDLWRNALAQLESKLGRADLDATLLKFIEDFPPLAIYRNEVDTEKYLGDESNRQTALEELMMLWLANENPALENLGELCDDAELESQTAYVPVVAALHDFFAAQPNFGDGEQDLIGFLRSPALAVPDSIGGQLRYIEEHWKFLSPEFFGRLQLGLDVLQEENRARFSGPGPQAVPDYAAGFDDESERFSPDKDWMPRAVIMAKNAFVWRDQLSKKYARKITDLSEIPDEELDALARAGFNGLWLIGLWERSRASRQIKQMCGNPDAVASAYSLHDYCIASDLGGEESLENLRHRAQQRGIRLASDMVPNHMAIDSRWLVEHPDWFLSLTQPPFPAYSFNGTDLSHDDRVGIYLEDHYYSRQDAAVVFKRVDKNSGETRFVYHGNDGTSMPWNDTAQLDYLNPQVREALIQTILHVARQFPIIRFDAAMTLAKKHYQRLWFPEPGHGGAIPSRAEHGLTKEQFNAAMPQEFWREVVDRVAQEAPDTLLLAEAFWMMEGYFVRTLGMHRVYNSAFMNMLRDEENAEYRAVLKNTLEFDGDILKRFVNFMNNPDEDTAVAQFGKGDKYFGVCTLMVTLPGLPMFGHGQIEGFAEKYGMEYQRAYWDETPDEELIFRHRREIFPLLQRRSVFAEVRDFALYDFWQGEAVNEDVFAYSNRDGKQKGLVVFHNRFAETKGWIRSSVGAMNKSENRIEQKTLGEGMEIGGEFQTFRDQVSGLEFIRRSDELRERGLYLELGAYDCHVFLDWREVSGEKYARIAAYLNGRGAENIENLDREIALLPIHDPFRTLINAEFLARLISASRARHDADAGAPHIAVLEEVERHAADYALAQINFAGAAERDEATMHYIAHKSSETIWAAMQVFDAQTPAAIALRARLENRPLAHAALFAALLLASLDVLGEPDVYMEDWQTAPLIEEALQPFGDENAVRRTVAAIKFLLGNMYRNWSDTTEIVESALNNLGGQNALGVNRFEEVLWFDSEAFAIFLTLLFAGAATRDYPENELETRDALFQRAHEATTKLENAAKNSGYRVDKFLEFLSTSPKDKDS